MKFKYLIFLMCAATFVSAEDEKKKNRFEDFIQGKNQMPGNRSDHRRRPWVERDDGPVLRHASAADVRRVFAEELESVRLAVNASRAVAVAAKACAAAARAACRESEDTLDRVVGAGVLCRLWRQISRLAEDIYSLFFARDPWTSDIDVIRAIQNKMEDYKRDGFDPTRY